MQLFSPLACFARAALRARLHSQVQASSAWAQPDPCPPPTSHWFQVFDVTEAAAPAPPPPPPAAVAAALSENFAPPAPFAYSLGQYQGAAASVAFTSGAAVVTVAAPGAAAWNLQLTSPFLQLGAGAPGYSARLRASASAPTAVNVLWLREGTFAVAGLKTFTLGPAAQLLELGTVELPSNGPWHLQVRVWAHAHRHRHALVWGALPAGGGARRAVVFVPAQDPSTIPIHPLGCVPALPIPTQIEFGTAAAGTVLTFDDIQAGPGALPEAGGGGDGPAGGGPAPPPPPPPPPAGAAVAIPESTTGFEAGAPAVATGLAFGRAAATFTFGVPSAAATGAAGATAAVTTGGAASFNLQLVGPWLQLDPAKTYTARVQVGQVGDGAWAVGVASAWGLVPAACCGPRGRLPHHARTAAPRLGRRPAPALPPPTRCAPPRRRPSCCCCSAAPVSHRSRPRSRR
jgi:hypothetical protein